MNTYFVLSIVSILSAVTIVALKVCYASKCDSIKLCFGLIDIEREVSLENRQFDMETKTLTPNFLTTQMRTLKNDLPKNLPPV